MPISPPQEQNSCGASIFYWAAEHFSYGRFFRNRLKMGTIRGGKFFLKQAYPIQLGLDPPNAKWPKQHKKKISKVLIKTDLSLLLNGF